MKREFLEDSTAVHTVSECQHQCTELFHLIIASHHLAFVFLTAQGMGDKNPAKHKIPFFFELLPCALSAAADEMTHGDVISALLVH